MPKRAFIKTVTRNAFGGTFYFHIYEDTRMVHVVGRADRESTGKPPSGASDMIVNDLVDTLLERGRCPAGPFDKPW